MGDRRRPGKGSCLCGPCRSCVFPVQVASCTGHCGGWGGDGRGRLRGTSEPLRPIGSPAAPVRTPCPIAPSAAERVRLKKMAYGHKTEHRRRVRAQVVLHAARGRSNACIARETGLHLDTVRRWRSRSSGGSPPPTWTICWPGSTGTPPITTKNPLSHRQREQPPKDLRRRPLSGLGEVRFGTAVPDRGAGISGALRRARLAP